ncbi:MAG TPA: type II toxin-antitoxin system mRNA interferase toxin, RelE/StbE family [Oleiagrimonas sp.]|nr:type II toxin-antitoxin system mRNA interferase toxin, RelE/StbE family [Oleiagrimonas sp.]
MWRILEHRQADKELSSGRVPLVILKRYEKWKDIAMLSGPQGLRAIRGFHDEALPGEWKGFRSSRLNEQWRVIYCVEADVMTVQVVRVTAHDYRRRRDEQTH